MSRYRVSCSHRLFAPEAAPPGLVAARLLGQPLLLIPATGRAKVAEEICSTSNHTELIDLAQFYINTSIKACKHVWFMPRNEFMLLIVKRSSGQIPAPSDHSSRASLEEERNSWVNLNESCKFDHRTARGAASSYSIILRLFAYLCIRS